MDGTKFVQVINYYGEENILAILYDNSAVKIFREGEFTLANNYIAELEALQFPEIDYRGAMFHTVKDVENIQGIIVKDENTPFGDYDTARIRG